MSFFNIAVFNVCKYLKPCQDPRFHAVVFVIGWSQSVNRTDEPFWPKNLTWGIANTVLGSVRPGHAAPVHFPGPESQE